MIRKILLIVLCLSFIASSALAVSPASGRFSREGDVPGHVKWSTSTADENALTGAVKVYAVTLYALGALSYVNLYNGSTAVGDAFEVSEAVLGNTRRIVCDPPLNFNDGVYVDVSDATVVLEYR